MSYSRACPLCQVAKPRAGKPVGFMKPVESSYPWQIVACDVMGPLPRSARGNQFILVITDHFSKWVELFPLRKLASERIVEKLLETFTRFGFPSDLITDNASYFTSKVFSDCCRALHIRHRKTSPYHAQSNITERVNRNLKCMLVATTKEHKDWDARLPELAFATRTTVNRSTGLTPGYLNFGREIAFPMENALLYAAAGNAPSLSQYAARLRERLWAAQRTARENLDVARMEQAEQYNKGRRHLVYNIGDLVLRRTHPLSNAARGFTAALAHKWQGPYRITAQTTLLTYEMQSLESDELVGPVHVSDLKAYHVRTGDDEQVVAEPEGGSPASNDRTAGDRVRTHRYDLRVR